MEKMNKDHDHCCENGCCKRRGLVWRLLRVMVGAVIVLLILALGVAAGKRQALRHLGYGPEMMQTNSGEMNEDSMSIGQRISNKMMMFRGPDMGSSTPQNMMFKTVGTRIAGTVTAINGAQITVVDNGGATQTIYSTADTIITSPSGEQPLANIKVKQFIVSFVTGKDGKNMAQMIQLQ